MFIILADVIFFSVVFIKFDADNSRDWSNDLSAAEWIGCLISSGGNKSECLSLAAPMIISQATAMAVLYLLALNGIWSLLLLGRWSMTTGWIDLIKTPFKRSRDHFVSVDARRLSETRNYEMLDSLTTAKLSAQGYIIADKIDDYSNNELSPSSNAFCVSPDIKMTTSEWNSSNPPIFQTNVHNFSKPRPSSRSNSGAGITLQQQDLGFRQDRAKVNVPSPVYEQPTPPSSVHLREKERELARQHDHEFAFEKQQRERELDLPRHPSCDHGTRRPHDLGLSSSPPPEDYRDDAASPYHFEHPIAPSPTPQQRETESSATQSTDRSASSLSPTRSPSAMSNARSDSALARERTGSALGRRERDVRAPTAHAQVRVVANGPLPPRRSNSHAALGREWDPRSTFAKGTGT